MTNREAIKIFQNIIRCNENTECDCDCMVCECDDGTTTAEEMEAIKLAISALEKQEVKDSPCEAPVMAKAFDGENRALTYECVSCPNCKKWLSIFGTGKSYCPYCGQAVKSRQYNEEG